MPKFLDIEVQVTVDGNALKEFSTETLQREALKGATCYIPSRIGQVRACLVQDCTRSNTFVSIAVLHWNS